MVPGVRRDAAMILSAFSQNDRTQATSMEKHSTRLTDKEDGWMYFMRTPFETRALVAGDTEFVIFYLYSKFIQSL